MISRVIILAFGRSRRCARPLPPIWSLRNLIELALAVWLVLWIMTRP
jgi:hypothetical protein